MISKEHREKLDQLSVELNESYENLGAINNFDGINLPSYQKIIEISKTLLEVLFPGFISHGRIHSKYQQGWIAEKLELLFLEISDQVKNSVKFASPDLCEGNCDEKARELTADILNLLPNIRKVLRTDVEAAFIGDPAALHREEIILCYPSIFAVSLHRVAHEFYKRSVPLIPRMIAEYAHRETGIDIHPGAQINQSFFIDHGTGVVIGETAIIGENVKIYQNVTLGALSFRKDEDGNLLRNKRHPTIENDVVIYSGSSILGGDTVVGEKSVVGGNVWITETIAKDTTILFDSQSQKLKIYSKSA